MDRELFPQTDRIGSKFPGPMTFDGDVAQKWTRFKLKFMLCLLDSGNETATDRKKVSLLLSAIGREGQGIYDSFNLSESEKWEYDLVLNRFSQHCVPKINLTHARYTFFKEKQAAKQSFDNFVKSLHAKAKNCAFAFLKDSLVKDMIVVGVRDPGLRAKLLNIGDLNLTMACDIGQTHEAEASGNAIKSILPAGISCSLCSFTDDSSDRVKKHFERMHVERAIQILHYQCLHCGCSEYEELHYHCPMCDVISTDEQLLTRHALAEHEGVSVVAAVSESCSAGDAQSGSIADGALVPDVTYAQIMVEEPSSPNEPSCKEGVEAPEHNDEPAPGRSDLMHISVERGHKPTIPSPPICTLCTTLVNGKAHMKRHFLSVHWNHRCMFGEYKIMACKHADCTKKKSHYHCFNCTWTGKRRLISNHIQKCIENKYHARPRRPVKRERDDAPLQQASAEPEQHANADLTTVACEGKA